MAFSSSSSSSDNKVPSCSKACSKAYAQLHSQYDKLTDDFRKSQFDVLSYQAGLESVEARLVVYKQNESILEENINLLKNEVQARDNVLFTLRQKLNQAEQEMDDLKLKLDKFQTSSKNLTELLASQTNDKRSLGYFSSESDSEILSPSSPFDRLQPTGGYHAVPPPIKGTFIPPKPDLVFHTALIAVETDHFAFTVQLSPSKPVQDLSHTTRPLAPIIEEWVSDSEDEAETNDPQIVPSFVQSSKQVTSPRTSVQPTEAPILDATPKLASPNSNRCGKIKNRKTCFMCRSVDHLIKDCDYHSKKKTQPTPRNYAHGGINKQNASFTHKHLPKHMAPGVVLTQSKPVSITAVRPVSAAVPKIMAPVVSTAKVAQDLEIIKLKKRVKKPKRANKIKVLKLRRLKKVGTSQRVESSIDTDMEDASNQERMIDELDRDEGVALMGEKEEEKKAKEVKDIAGDEQVKGRQAEIYQIYIGSNAKYNKTSSGRADFRVDAAMELEEKHEVFNAAGEELSAAKQKLMLLDIAAERRLMQLSQVKTVNGKCCLNT
nr:hypothetical protein [Tanacetum cinerariifolium]